MAKKEERLSSWRGVLLSLQKSTAALMTAMLAGLGCSSPPEQVRLDVYSWWEQQAESSAFERVVQVHERRMRNEGVTVRNLGDSTSGDARRTLAESLLLGVPPATFQANVGADVLRWTVVDMVSIRPGDAGEVKRSSYIADLSEVFEREELESQLSDELMSALSLGDPKKPYAVPINIHRLNTLYYNTARLEAFKSLHGGKSFLDIATLCPAERHAGALPGVKIAIGAEAEFTLTLLTFENVLPALSGAKFYDDLFRGKLGTSEAEVAVWSEEVRRALRCVQYLSRSFLELSTRTTWFEALYAVRRGDADFTVMGDWANGPLRSELRNDVVRAIPFPGTEGVFVFTSDTFPLPFQAEHRSEVVDLLRTIASDEAQYEFSVVKGSIPAREDVDLEGLEPVQRETRDAFDGATRVLATSGLLPPYYPLADLDAKLKAMIQPRAGEEEVEVALTEFVAASALLRRWQERLAQGAGDAVAP